MGDEIIMYKVKFCLVIHVIMCTLFGLYKNHSIGFPSNAKNCLVKENENVPGTYNSTSDFQGMYD